MNEKETLKNIILINDNSLIDSHTHCGFGHYNLIQQRYPTSQSVIDLESKTELAGIDFVISFPFPGELYYFDIFANSESDLPQHPPIEKFPYHFANRQLLYEISLFGNNRIIPFANIYPNHEEGQQADYLDELAKQGLIFGLKLHTLATQYSAEALAKSPFLDVSRAHSLPVIIHSGPDDISHPMNVVELAETNPDIRFCIAHIARFEKQVFDYIRNNNLQNVFIDTAPLLSLCKLTQLDINNGIGGEKLNLPYDSPQQTLVELCKLMPGHIVWGTDEPWTTITDDKQKQILMKARYGDEVAILRSIPPKLTKEIAHDNPIKLLFSNYVPSEIQL